jgi:hypothetical protein
MVKISTSGSGEGPGWATAPGYSTTLGLQNVWNVAGKKPSDFNLYRVFADYAGWRSRQSGANSSLR